MVQRRLIDKDKANQDAGVHKIALKQFLEPVIPPPHLLDLPVGHGGGWKSNLIHSIKYFLHI